MSNLSVLEVKASITKHTRVEGCRHDDVCDVLLTCTRSDRVNVEDGVSSVDTVSDCVIPRDVNVHWGLGETVLEGTVEVKLVGWVSVAYGRTIGVNVRDLADTVGVNRF